MEYELVALSDVGGVDQVGVSGRHKRKVVSQPECHELVSRSIVGCGKVRAHCEASSLALCIKLITSYAAALGVGDDLWQLDPRNFVIDLI